MTQPLGRTINLNAEPGLFTKWGALISSEDNLDLATLNFSLEIPQASEVIINPILTKLTGVEAVFENEGKLVRRIMIEIKLQDTLPAVSSASAYLHVIGTPTAPLRSDNDGIFPIRVNINVVLGYWVIRSGHRPPA